MIHLLAYFPSVVSIEAFYSAHVTAFLPPIANDPEKFGHQWLVDEFDDVIGEDEHLLALPLMCSIDQLCDAIHASGGIFVPAHLDRSFSLIAQLGFIPDSLSIDAVEIYFLKNVQSMKDKYLTGKECQIISSSDTHHIDHLPPPKMRLWMNGVSIEEVFAALRGLDGRYIRLSRSSAVRSDVDDWRSLYR